MTGLRPLAVAACVFAPLIAPVSAQAAQARAPRVSLLVVFPDGSARESSVVAAATMAKVGRRRCAVPEGTALAALLRARLASVALRDYGSCSRRAADAAGLFVTTVGGWPNRGQDGWVYKVGPRSATSGAADPAGPFGHGPLGRGALVTWFYCHENARTHSCQPSLIARPAAIGGGRVQVTVKAYDDRGRDTPAAGATVHCGSVTATADSAGVATLAVATGPASVWVEEPGAVRSAYARVGVR